MRHRNLAVASLAFAGLTHLAACGGGGGGGSTPPAGGGPTPCPAGYTGTPPNCIAPVTPASVSGRVVDDTSGASLPGIKVGLAPWISGATPTPEGTTAPDGSFTFTAQPGHYLLVIGSDSSSDTTRATIHDNVTLVPGANALQAPVLPPWPTVTPPPWETNGTYRLGTIDATTELPCFNSYNTHRTGLSLAPAVFDEWLKENARDATTWHRSGVYNPANQTAASHALTMGNGGAVGGTDCATSMIAFEFSGSTTDLNSPPYYTHNANNQWFGGNYFAFHPGDTLSASGIDEFPIDPRFQADSIGNWP